MGERGLTDEEGGVVVVRGYRLGYRCLHGIVVPITSGGIGQKVLNFYLPDRTTGYDNSMT